MDCSSLSLSNISTAITREVKNHPIATLFFVLGAICLVSGIVGHYTGLNVIAGGVTTFSGGVFLAIYILVRGFAKDQTEEKKKPISLFRITPEDQKANKLQIEIPFRRLNASATEELKKVIAADDFEDVKSFFDADSTRVHAKLSDETGDTPLHLAVRLNKGGTIRELLKRGANPQLKNGAGMTASELARRF